MTAEADNLRAWKRPPEIPSVEAALVGGLLHPDAQDIAPGILAALHGQDFDEPLGLLVAMLKRDGLLPLPVLARQLEEEHGRGLGYWVQHLALIADDAALLHELPALVEAVREAAWRRREIQAYATLKEDPADTAALAQLDALKRERAAHRMPESLSLTRLSDVEADQVLWLWAGRIPLSKLTIIDGDPGVGKSLLTIDLAARITTGAKMPDGTPGQLARVLILTAEDGLGDTVRPRIEAAGGDASKILAYTPTNAQAIERLPVIPDDVAEIERIVESEGVALVIIDPLMAFLGGGTNAHRDQDVRRALAPLAKMAERTGAAVVAVRHLNKSSAANPIYRGGGSIGIIGAARAALLVAKHPEDEARRVLAPLKSNLAALADSLEFRIANVESGAAGIEWLGFTEHRAASLLAAQDDHERDGGALGEAQRFLRELLADGPRLATEVGSEAASAGVSGATLRRAKDELRVRAVKGKGAGAKWRWELAQ